MSAFAKPWPGSGMVGEWKETTWGDLATLEYGKALRDYGDEPRGARVFGTNGPIGWHDEALWEGPGVIVGRKGAYRGVHYSEGPYWVIDTAYSLKPKVPINLRWAYYQLKSIDLNTVDDGSPIPSTTRPAFYALPLMKPPRAEQDQIADLLTALDDKVEMNQRMAETLEAMARTLFKSWFVDFEPVHAKAEGRPIGLPDDLAAIFPDTFDEDGLPLGWTRRPFGEIFDVSGGNTPSTANPVFWNGPHQWATPKDLSSLASPVLLETERRLSDKGLQRCSSGLLPPGSLLLSSRAPIGYMAFTVHPTAINQGFAGIVKKNTSTAYAWGWCDANMNMITGNAGGSTFPEISKSVFRQLPMLVPERRVLEAYCDAVEPLVAQIIGSAREQQILAVLRDMLIPKLISGELRIIDAEKRISAA